jgi:1,2-diacylglycerol 3-alpha-glucosyltransferase
MEKLSIAFYSDTYLPNVDGVVTSIINFRKELEKRGHRVYVFASASPRNKRLYSDRKTFLYTGLSFKPYPQYSIAIFPYNSAIKLRSLGIDVIHAQTPFAMGFSGLMAGRISQYPVVGSFHTFVNNRHIVEHYYPKNKSVKRIASSYMKKYLRFFYKRCDSVIAPSETVKNMLYKNGIKSTYVVPNSIDTSKFNNKISGERIRKRYGIKERDKVILYVGRLSAEKRIETMLKASKLLMQKDEHVKVLITGKGPAESYYKELAHKLGIANRTHFTGFVDQKTLPEVYASSDLVCMPSTFETQGIVSIEAMACGKPVIGADYLSTKELIKNGFNGEKFRAGDYRQCSKKIDKVLNDTKPYIKNALETGRGFSSEKMTDKLIDVYKLLLSKQAID